ncbi:hypothetical protein D1818_02050 [Aquimarina sp. BL5]|uniref:hypothetical protein n=1 Tax=Aquimarina sp. BL5 TaxID=1714860 RepID=UPI000E4948CE|nr:hypothetical protein [Aquimarina sp. BL5]AXT49660.1 hypothetical protein D1818_02050 [Aquimarina sp. BL5]RKM87753.1 hypothetical protein D7036_24625 [Aquimarina sp. BL5]
MENQKKEKSWSKRKFADFQNKYRRSSNFGYGSKRDKFAIAGNGELSVPGNKNTSDKDATS